MINLPRILIGCSSEALPVAEAIQSNLHHAAEVTIWNQGLFQLGNGTLHSLTNAVGDFDFALLLLSPDDTVRSRSRQHKAPRDNVLFELGLCTGILGSDRTFMSFDSSKPLKIPSDLAGITAATFRPHESGNYRAATGSACTQIKEAMARLGCRARLPSLPPCTVEAYAHHSIFTDVHVSQLRSVALQLGFSFVSKSHSIAATPDSLFIGGLVSANEARAILPHVSYAPKFLFRPDYPEADGGCPNGRKIGLGYWSGYKGVSNTAPVSLSKRDWRHLTATHHTNTSFQMLVRDIVG